MESFYSIIYYRPNSLTDEFLAIGLLASGVEGPFIHISRRRLDLLKKTIHSSQYISVQRHFKNLSVSVNADRKAPNELLLFDPNYSKERLEQLSQMTKGAVSYSAPVTINEWLNASFFAELVQHFLGDRPSAPTRKNNLIFQLKWKAYYRSNQCKHWDRDVDSLDLNNQSIPMKIDLVDKENKRLVKSINFDLKPDTVRKKIQEIHLLSNTFQEYELVIVHPAPRKSSGKELFESMDGTVKNIKLIKFTEFKGNS